MADFVPRVTADQDGSLRHPAGTPAIGGANQMPGFSADMNQSAMHFAANPVGRVAAHVDFAASHFASHVAAHTSVDDDSPRLHLGADPVKASEIALPLVDFVGRITADSKEVSQPGLPVAFEDLKRFDFGQPFVADSVGCNAFDLQRHGRFGTKRKAEHGNSDFKFQISHLGSSITKNCGVECCLACPPNLKSEI